MPSIVPDPGDLGNPAASAVTLNDPNSVYNNNVAAQQGVTAVDESQYTDANRPEEESSMPSTMFSAPVMNNPSPAPATTPAPAATPAPQPQQQNMGDSWGNTTQHQIEPQTLFEAPASVVDSNVPEPAPSGGMVNVDPNHPTDQQSYDNYMEQNPQAMPQVTNPQGVPAPGSGAFGDMATTLEGFSPIAMAGAASVPPAGDDSTDINGFDLTSMGQGKGGLGPVSLNGFNPQTFSAPILSGPSPSTPTDIGDIDDEAQQQRQQNVFGIGNVVTLGGVPFAADSAGGFYNLRTGLEVSDPSTFAALKAGGDNSGIQTWNIAQLAKQYNSDDIGSFFGAGATTPQAPLVTTPPRMVDWQYSTGSIPTAVLTPDEPVYGDASLADKEAGIPVVTSGGQTLNDIWWNPTLGEFQDYFTQGERAAGDVEGGIGSGYMWSQGTDYHTPQGTWITGQSTATPTLATTQGTFLPGAGSQVLPGSLPDASSFTAPVVSALSPSTGPSTGQIMNDVLRQSVWPSVLPVDTNGFPSLDVNGTAANAALRQSVWPLPLNSTDSTDATASGFGDYGGLLGLGATDVTLPLGDGTGVIPGAASELWNGLSGLASGIGSWWNQQTQQAVLDDERAMGGNTSERGDAGDQKTGELSTGESTYLYMPTGGSTLSETSIPSTTLAQSAPVFYAPDLGPAAARYVLTPAPATPAVISLRSLKTVGSPPGSFQEDFRPRDQPADWTPSILSNPKVLDVLPSTPESAGYTDEQAVEAQAAKDIEPEDLLGGLLGLLSLGRTDVTLPLGNITMGTATPGPALAYTASGDINPGTGILGAVEGAAGGLWNDLKGIAGGVGSALGTNPITGRGWLDLKPSGEPSEWLPDWSGTGNFTPEQLNMTPSQAKSSLSTYDYAQWQNAQLAANNSTANQRVGPAMLNLNAMMSNWAQTRPGWESVPAVAGTDLFQILPMAIGGAGSDAGYVSDIGKLGVKEGPISSGLSKAWDAYTNSPLWDNMYSFGKITPPAEQSVADADKTLADWSQMSTSDRILSRILSRDAGVEVPPPTTPSSDPSISAMPGKYDLISRIVNRDAAADANMDNIQYNYGLENSGDFFNLMDSSLGDLSKIGVPEGYPIMPGDDSTPEPPIQGQDPGTGLTPEPPTPPAPPISTTIQLQGQGTVPPDLFSYPDLSGDTGTGEGGDTWTPDITGQFTPQDIGDTDAEDELPSPEVPGIPLILPGLPSVGAPGPGNASPLHLFTYKNNIWSFSPFAGSMGDFDLSALGLGAALGSSSMFDMDDIASSMPGVAGNPLGGMDTMANPVDAGLSPSGDFFDSSMNDMGNSIQAAASGLFDAPSESFLNTDETGGDDYMPGQGYSNPRELDLDARGSDYVYYPSTLELLNDARDTYRRIHPYGKAVHTRAPRELDLDDYGTEYVYTPTPHELLSDAGNLYRRIRSGRATEAPMLMYGAVPVERRELPMAEVGDEELFPYDYLPGRGYNSGPRQLDLDEKGVVYYPTPRELLGDARNAYRRVRPERDTRFEAFMAIKQMRERAAPHDHGLDLDRSGDDYVFYPTPRELLDDAGSLYRHIRGRGYNGHTTITLPEQSGPKSIGKAWRLAREPGLGRKKFTTLYDGTEVDMVNGSYIRDTTTEDYLLGSNPRADPALVPPKHIYISDINVRAPNGLHDAYGIITHEGSEVGGMKYGGLSYRLAHEHYGEVGEELFRNTVPANASERTMWLASNRIIKMETERAATHSHNYGMDFIGLANSGKRASGGMEFGGLANIGSGLSLDLDMGSYKLPTGDYASGFSALKLDFGGLGVTGRKQKDYDYGDSAGGFGFDLNSLGFDRVSARTARKAMKDSIGDGIGFAIGAIGTGMALGIGMNVMKGFTNNNNFFGGGRLW